MRIHTALLDALDGSTGDGAVYGLGGILDCVDGALASDGGGAEQAGLAGDLGAEHGCGGEKCCEVELEDTVMICLGAGENS